MPPQEGGATSCLQLRARLSTQKIEVSLAQDNRQEDKHKAGEQTRGERLPHQQHRKQHARRRLHRKEQRARRSRDMRQADVLDEQSHACAAHREKRHRTDKARRPHGQRRLGFDSSDETRLRMPLPTNIQNVMTLMSILRPYLAVTAIWMAKKTAPPSVMASPILNSTLSSATRPMPAKHSSAAPRL